MYPCLECGREATDHKLKYCDQCRGFDIIKVSSKEILEAGIMGHDLIMAKLGPGDRIHSFTTDNDGGHVVKIIKARNINGSR